MSFEHVQEILFIGHSKTSDSPEQTLDRVFRKGLRRSGVSTQTIPEITHSHLEVSIETRDAADLLPLATRGPKSRVSKKIRQYSDTPVIVCAYAGREYLIDGNRRVHHLHDLGLQVRVYVCRLI